METKTQPNDPHSSVSAPTVAARSRQSPPVDRRARVVVATMAGAAFVSSLDLFVVNVAFDRIGADFGVGTPGGPSAADLSWVLTAYAVTFAALLVPFGRLADRYGRRRMFLWGLALFVLGSAACAVSGSVAELVAFRVVQAIGAAALTPTSLSLLLAALPPARRLAGVRFWAATGAVAAAFGPSVGGLLTQVSWRWVFLINLPVGIALWIIAALRVRDSVPDRSAPRPDLLGAALFAVAVALAALGLVKSADWGWSDVATLACFAGAVILTTAFVLRSRHLIARSAPLGAACGSAATAAFAPRRSRHLIARSAPLGAACGSAATAAFAPRRSRQLVAPVISPALLRVRSFRNAVLAMFLFSVGFGANLLLGILWLQQIWGYSPLITGLAIVVGPLMVPITTALTQRFLPDVAPGRLAAAGALLFALGLVVAELRMTAAPGYLGGYVPGWFLCGIGVGLALPNLIGGATYDLAPEESATGSGVISMARQIGFVAGVSLLFAIVGSRSGAAALDSFRDTWWVLCGVLVLSAVTALRMGARRH